MTPEQDKSIFIHIIIPFSPFFIFAVSGAKVLLYDLSQSAPLIRIGCLLILGISLYLGGWLYHKVVALENSD